MATTAGAAANPRKTLADRGTRARFLRMLRTLLASEVGGKVRWLLATLILLLLAINGLNVLNSYVGRDFMTALEKRAVPIFLRQAVLYVGVFALSTLADVFLRYTEEKLGLTWREWLSRWAVGCYLRPFVSHRLSDRLLANGEVPNPDERISDDIRAFTTITLSLLLLFLNGTFTMVAFSGVLWSISPALFLVAVLYAAAGSLLTIFRGRPLVRLNGVQLDKEANFRAELIHVRENAEALAISRRGDLLRARLLHRIGEWAANFRKIIRVNRNLGFFRTGYSYLIQIIPALIVGPLFIRGDVEFGVVTQSAMAFAQLVGAFSLIITQFASISSYTAIVARLGALDEGIELARVAPASGLEVVAREEDPTVAYEGLTLWSPGDGRVLLRDLRGSAAPGTRLLILGPNEEAKAALFRATAGTWVAGRGRILRPEDDRMLFLAERPYLPPGTLREVLTGEHPAAAIPDERILALLRDLGLESIPSRVGGLDVERRWDSLLSFGEQQRMALAHALLSAPRAVFLERPDTAIGAEALGGILSLFAAASISVFTIAGSDAALRSYQARLDLADDGGWEWRPIPAGPTS